MAAPLVVAKAALKANKDIQRKVPGGWITVIAAVLAVIIIVPILAFQSVTSALAPYVKGGYQELCASPAVNGDSGGNTPHQGTDPLSALGIFSTVATPWPTSDSANIVYPAPHPVMTSGYGLRNLGMGTPAFHNGQDFGQPGGSPVLSIADGIVATAAAGNSPYGSHVAVKHTINGKHYTSVYGHVIGSSITVKPGQVIKAGTQIASVGMEGLSTGFHIHLTLVMGDYSPAASEPWGAGAGASGTGNTIDPGLFLTSNGAKTASGGLSGDTFTGVTNSSDESCKNGSQGLEGDGFSSWGGFKNGEISGTSAIAFDPSKSLMSRAATDLNALNTAYKAKFGKNLVVETAYLSKGVQQSMYETGAQIEPAGSSIYGWARGVKLALSFGSAEYSWMQSNAGKYGWVQPSNYSQGGSAANAGIWGYKGGGSDSDIPVPANASAAESQAIAKKILESEHGWGQAEFSCLVKLWDHESNWNYKAENPTSGAYGIVQALPASKMNSVGTDWKTNPATQIRWGLTYIGDRYGTPCKAWSFWQETDPAKKSGYPGNWY